MSDDVFSAKDSEFDKFQTQYVSTIALNPAKYGHTPQDVAALKAEQAAWVADYAGHIKGQADARTLTQKKDGTRGTYETTRLRSTRPATRTSRSTHVRRTRTRTWLRTRG